LGIGPLTIFFKESLLGPIETTTPIRLGIELFPIFTNEHKKRINQRIGYSDAIKNKNKNYIEN
jgi:hypothetical protein